MYRLPQIKRIGGTKKKTTKELIFKTLTSRDRYSINKLFGNIQNIDPALKIIYKENLYSLLNSYISEGKLIKAQQILKAEKTKDATDKKLTEIELKLNKENFRINYYETRISILETGNKKIPEWEWNGNTKNCSKGNIPDYINQKVEDRINFFRVNAGVPPIYLDSQLNDWCQRAALVMESNSKLMHEIPKTWSCYSPEAAEAAKYSLLIQNTNPAIAVTSFMDDNKNPSIGNRRWMLYPFSMIWGVGSTNTKCVLWALDDSRIKDTLLYKTNFVAWPYDGYIHKMFLFKKWSFSINQDLQDAKITMFYNKTQLTFTSEKPAEGYGLPTLVWTPAIDVSKLKDGDEIKVSVKLKNNLTFTYNVKIFEYTP